jgi:hypothetical protein
MRGRNRWTSAAVLAGAVLGMNAAGALAQSSMTAPQVTSPAPDPVAVDDKAAVDALDAETRARALEQRAARVALERDLRKLRFKYFSSNFTELRQQGILKLREVTDPAAFPLFVSIFERDQKDVRQAILDHLLDIGTPEADATLAWSAVYDREAWFRKAASDALARRHTASGEVSVPVRSVIAQSLRSSNETTIASGAQLAQTLSLFDAIPMLINAQVSGGATGGGSGGGAGGGSLAFILVGTQQAFVADLTPVVGDSAVAFDPTLGVVTDGTVMRIIDAVVITYRIEVHNALVRLANAGWDGRDTSPMGWDGGKWREWYTKDFVPYRARLASGAK